MLVMILGTTAVILLALYMMRRRRARLSREEQFMSQSALRVLRDS
jgi:hypothetical protein